MSACEIAEIMIFDRQISDSERMKIEGSLAHKWGIESSVLEASHPYFSYSPYGQTQQITLNAPATLGRNVNYAWAKNGTVITGASSSSISVPTDESAEYSIIASNLFGNDQHDFSVATTPVPPVLNQMPTPSLMFRN